MKDYIQNAKTFLETEKLRLAAMNLQHLLKIQEEQVTLDAIVHDLQRTMIDAHAGVPDDFSDLLASQARILDATFNYFLNKSKGAYSEEDKVNIAMRAQRQSERAIMAWKKLRKQDGPQKFPKLPERTRQNDAPLDPASAS
jgi:hypothetical protein